MMSSLTSDNRPGTRQFGIEQILRFSDIFELKDKTAEHLMDLLRMIVGVFDS